MSIGTKIKEARISINMTQEELAGKLDVSRQAISKWESDRGIPDIDNLKKISSLLDISIDYLVNEDCDVKYVFREDIDLSLYGKGRKKVLKDKVIRSYFKDDMIETLLCSKVLTKGEKITDLLLGFLTDAPFGIPEFLNSIKHLDKEYYLITRDDGYILACVSHTDICYYKLDIEINSKVFYYNGYRYTNCGKIIYA